jgi:hypothetical protein
MQGIESDGDTVTMSQEAYEELKGDADFLRLLMACGVDNWEGYTQAQEMRED